MDNERWKELMADDNAQLTPQEIKSGWHFCYDFDGLLIGPGMDEFNLCSCFTQ